MSLWSFLKWMLSKKQRPVFPTEGYSLYYDKTGATKLLSLNCWEPGPNNFALWLEIWQALMEGRPCLTYEECWHYVYKREVKRKTELTYEETFVMHFGREHLDDSKTHTRLTDGWKEIYSVGIGIDRQMLAAKYLDYAEERYGPWNCATTLYALKDLSMCRTLEEARACTKQPGLFSACYDIDEDWLDITLPDEETEAFVVKTIQEVLSAHGKSLCMLDTEK